MGGAVTFTLARFERSRVPGLFATVPLERVRFQRQRGLAWGRHLGTSAGERTSGVQAARWAWFGVWDDEAPAGRFHDGLTGRLHPTEIATLTLRPLRARGTWGGHEIPTTTRDGDRQHEGPLVVLTRARVRATRWRPFSGAIPPVDADLQRAAGRLRSVGVGEWPVLVQGTVSVWRDAAAMTAFSRTEAHRTAVRRTADERWYAEELFARFSVERAEGTWDGAPALDPPQPTGR